jgi:hypothetical protein
MKNTPVNIHRLENEQFFQCLGEIWRDITAIEFLMRCAIAAREGDIDQFPQPPYEKGKSYKKYPESFSHLNFEMVTKKFNTRFLHLRIPEEVIHLRDAMAHGVIAEINKNGITQLVKFKENKEEKALIVEFSLTLENKIIAQIRQSLRALRTSIMDEVNKESTPKAI